jgi:hypothetical protein
VIWSGVRTAPSFRIGEGVGYVARTERAHAHPRDDKGPGLAVDETRASVAPRLSAFVIELIVGAEAVPTSVPVTKVAQGYFANSPALDANLGIIRQSVHVPQRK